MNNRITDHHEWKSSPMMWIIRPYRDRMTSLDDIATTIDIDGFDALDNQAIDDVLTLAADADASPVLAEVFGDDHEPAPVRERAFGLLAMQIVSGTTRSTTRRRMVGRRLRSNTSDSVQSTPCS